MSKILIIFFLLDIYGFSVSQRTILLFGEKVENLQSIDLLPAALTRKAVLYQSTNGNGWTIPPEILLSLKRPFSAV